MVPAAVPAVASIVLVLTAGCGAGTEAAAPEPIGAQATTPPAPSPASPTAVESPTASASPTSRPLSRFEDEPPVVAARAWAAAMARAVNEKDKTLKGAARLMTQRGRKQFIGYVREDLGLHYPGPMPFTPTDVTTKGRGAEVSVCWWGYGFALDPATKRPVDQRRVEPATMFLKKQDGRWKLEDLLAADSDCSGVPVKGVGW